MIATLAPSPTNSRAVASPIPLSPPVISATLSASRPIAASQPWIWILGHCPITLPDDGGARLPRCRGRGRTASDASRLVQMRIAIAGANGKVARRLTERLAAGGDTVVALVRNPDHADELRAPGVEPVVCDLEHATVDEVIEALRGADAAVFAAGAGAGSGAERKLTMDRDGAIKFVRPRPPPALSAT